MSQDGAIVQVHENQLTTNTQQTVPNDVDPEAVVLKVPKKGSFGSSPTETNSESINSIPKEKEAIPDGKVELTPKELFRYKLEGLRVVIGGVLIHLVLGTFYLWGAVSVYVSSYLLEHDSSADINNVKLVFPLMLLAINLMLTLGLKISQRFGERNTCLVGVVIIAVCVFAASYIKSFAGFTIVYGIIFGLANGLIYMTPVNCGWKYFPHRKGAVSGAIIGGFGFGTFIFNFVAQAIVNPDNVKASIKYEGNSYFPEEIYSRIPKMFRVLAGCYLALGLIGALMITTPKVSPSNYPPAPKVKANDKKGNQVIQVQSTRKQADTILEGLKHYSFWVLLAVTTFSSFYGMLFSNNYKVYGMTTINDDLFLTTVGSVGSAVNGISRLMWASLTDKFGFKKIFFILLTIQLIMVGTLTSVSKIKPLYMIWYLVSMSCEGGQLSMMPAVTYKAFGTKKGPMIYGFVYSGFTIANLAAFFLTKYAQISLGWGNIFWICFGFTVLAMLVDLLVNETPDLDKGSKKSVETQNQ